MKKFVAALWLGEVPLATTFWEYGVIYAVLANVAASIGELVLFSAGQLLFGLVVHVLPIPYNLFILVAVWRSANRYTGDPQWAHAAKVVAVIGLTLASVL